jgi:hypothetical protein
VLLTAGGRRSLTRKALRPARTVQPPRS